jgi:hypothetical protein
MKEQKPKGGTPEYRAWYYKNKYQKTGKSKKKEFEKRNKEFIIRFKKRCKCIKCSLDKWYLIEFNAYSIKTIKKEIRKCVPICRNCHMEYHYLERQKIISTFKEYLKLTI